MAHCWSFQTIRQNMETVSSPSVTWLLMDALSWTEFSMAMSFMVDGGVRICRVTTAAGARSIYSVA